MPRVHHTIRLIGRDGYGSEAPPDPVGNVLRLIGRPCGNRSSWDSSAAAAAGPPAGLARFGIRHPVRGDRRGS